MGRIVASAGEQADRLHPRCMGDAAVLGSDARLLPGPAATSAWRRPGRARTGPWRPSGPTRRLCWGWAWARSRPTTSRLVRALDEPPILIGHSFGGLIVQLLLDRGLGTAGVALDPAPPSGVWAFEPTAFRSLASVILTWRGWHKIVRWSPAQFAYAFVNGLPPAEQQAAYDAHVTPETGRIFFQGALASMSGGSPCRVDFARNPRAPLLLIAGLNDHIVPPVIVRRTYRRYACSCPGDRDRPARVPRPDALAHRAGRVAGDRRGDRNLDRVADRLRSGAPDCRSLTGHASGRWARRAAAPFALAKCALLHDE